MEEMNLKTHRSHRIVSPSNALSLRQLAGACDTLGFSPLTDALVALADLLPHEGPYNKPAINEALAVMWHHIDECINTWHTQLDESTRELTTGELVERLRLFIVAADTLDLGDLVTVAKRTLKERVGIPTSQQKATRVTQTFTDLHASPLPTSSPKFETGQLVWIHVPPNSVYECDGSRYPACTRRPVTGPQLAIVLTWIFDQTTSGYVYTVKVGDTSCICTYRSFTQLQVYEQDLLALCITGEALEARKRFVKAYSEMGRETRRKALFGDLPLIAEGWLVTCGWLSLEDYEAGIRAPSNAYAAKRRCDDTHSCLVRAAKRQRPST